MDSEAEPEVYGYACLDELHYLFPEILYDNVIFPNNETNRMLNWIRHRMTYLFPQSFRRARHDYERLHAEIRRNDYEDWIFLQRPEPPVRAPVQVVMRDYPGFEARNTILPNHVLQTPPRVPRTSSQESVRTLLGLLNQADSPQNSLRWTAEPRRLHPITVAGARSPALDWLSLFFDTVPIVPSAADIHANTEVLQAASVPADIICTNCQDHDSEALTPGGCVGIEWRMLRTCQHKFHKGCIDRWFERNSHCPVCRADIRMPAIRPQTTSGQHVSQSVAESVLSNPPP